MAKRTDRTIGCAHLVVFCSHPSLGYSQQFGGISTEEMGWASMKPAGNRRHGDALGSRTAHETVASLVASHETSLKTPMYKLGKVCLNAERHLDIEGQKSCLELQLLGQFHISDGLRGTRINGLFQE